MIQFAIRQWVSQPCEASQDISQSSSDDLKATAQELQDLVQGKVGTTKFTVIYGQIRQGTIAKRRERKVARATIVSTEYSVQARS